MVSKRSKDRYKNISKYNPVHEIKNSFLNGGHVKYVLAQNRVNVAREDILEVMSDIQI